MDMMIGHMMPLFGFSTTPLDVSVSDSQAGLAVDNNLTAVPGSQTSLVQRPGLFRSFSSFVTSHPKMLGALAFSAVVLALPDVSLGAELSDEPLGYVFGARSLMEGAASLIGLASGMRVINKSVGLNAFFRRTQQLKKIVSGKNRKRAQKALNKLIEMGCKDFSGLDLSGLDLSHKDLKDVKFIGANLEGTVFENAQLKNVDFTKANLNHAFFQNAKLTNVDFSGVTMAGASFADANINDTKFIETNLTNVTFDSAVIGLSKFNEAQLKQVSFNSVQIHGCHFEQTQFDDCSFKIAKVYDSFFIEAKFIHDCDFEKAKLTSLDFSGAKLGGIKFKQTELVTPILSSDTDIQGIDLTELNCGILVLVMGLGGADELNAAEDPFKGVRMKGNLLCWLIYYGVRNFKGADLSQVVIHNANLENIDIRGAILEGIELVGDADLSLVIWDTQTQIKNANLKGANINWDTFVAARGGVEAINASEKPFEGVQFSADQFRLLVEMGITNFSGVCLENIDLTELEARGLNLSYATLTRVIFSGAILQGANLEGAFCTSVNWARADLTDVSWANVQSIKGCVFSGFCDVNWSDVVEGLGGLIVLNGDTNPLEGVMLGTTAFKKLLELYVWNYRKTHLCIESDGTNLFGCDFRDAVFAFGSRIQATGVYLIKFQGADLRRVRIDWSGFVPSSSDVASLRGTRLNRDHVRDLISLGMTNFEGVDLEGIDLRGIDLSEVSLEGANLQGAQRDRVSLQVH